MNSNPTFEILKIVSTGQWVLLIHRADGNMNDYRFRTKKELNRWLEKAGLI